MAAHFREHAGADPDGSESGSSHGQTFPSMIFRDWPFGYSIRCWPEVYIHYFELPQNWANIGQQWYVL